jgi:hypothetical protein
MEMPMHNYVVLEKKSEDCYANAKQFLFQHVITFKMKPTSFNFNQNNVNNNEMQQSESIIQ